MNFPLRFNSLSSLWRTAARHRATAGVFEREAMIHSGPVATHKSMFLTILDMESVQCSSCQQRFDDITLLSLHHEFESCSPASTAAWKNDFSCPLCDQIFDDPQVLQIHVDQAHDSPSASATTSDSLYAQDLARRERMKTEYEQQRAAESATSNEDLLEDEDTRIARMLQEEEDAQSFAEFQVENDTYEKAVLEKNSFEESIRWQYANFQRTCGVESRQTIPEEVHFPRAIRRIQEKLRSDDRATDRTTRIENIR